VGTQRIAEGRFRNFRAGEQILPTAAAREILNGAKWGVFGITVHSINVAPSGRYYSVKIGQDVLPVSFWEKGFMFYSLPPD
jgi:hypothetical protein